MTDKLFRYVDNYMPSTIFDNYMPSTIFDNEETNIPILEAYPIKRETAKTWFIDYYKIEKRVGKEWKKQFACETVERAKESYIKRKKMQILINENTLNIAKLGLIGINKASNKETDSWLS